MSKLKKVLAFAGVVTMLSITSAQALTPAVATSTTIYSCNAGDTRNGTTCTHVTPATSGTPDVVTTYDATLTQSTYTDWQWLCNTNTDRGGTYLRHDGNTVYCSNDPNTANVIYGYAMGQAQRTTTVYACNLGDTLSGSTCTHTVAGTPATPETSSTYQATATENTTYSCPNGGTLTGQNCVNGVSDVILAPVPAVKSFVTDHLLPLVSGFILLSISIALAVKTVRKFGSKLI